MRQRITNAMFGVAFLSAVATATVLLEAAPAWTSSQEECDCFYEGDEDYIWGKVYLHENGEDILCLTEVPCSVPAN